MRRLTRFCCGAATVAVFSAPYLEAQTATPAAAGSLSIATYYNSGSGFHSAWQSGGTGTGASPSSGYIIRLSAFYRDANGNISDLGQGAATATITLTVGGNPYKIGSSAPCSCRSVEFAQPGLSASSSITYSGVTLGTQSAYTLVMTVASSSAYDANSPVTASYQYGGSNGSVNLEENEIFYPSQSVLYVAVRLVNYTNAAASQDFLTYTGGSASDTRTVYFKVGTDSNTYSATFSGSTSKVIVKLNQTDSLTANQTGIVWWQTAPANESVYVWIYPWSSALS
jgi:hypothetical protein